MSYAFINAARHFIVLGWVVNMERENCHTQYTNLLGLQHVIFRTKSYLLFFEELSWVPFVFLIIFALCDIFLPLLPKSFGYFCIH